MSQAGITARDTLRVGRNDRCPCGSGRKFKHCCELKQARPTPSTAAPSTARTIAANVEAVKRLSAAGRWNDAIPLLIEIARLDPRSADAHHDLGVTCLRCGRAADAVLALQRAIELRPRFASALAALAEALDQVARERDAAAAFRRASEAAKEPVDRGIYLAKALMLEDCYEEAERELRRARSLAPTSAMPRYLLGQLAAQRGRFEQAREHLRSAMELAPDDPQAFADYAIITRMDDAARPLLMRMREAAERPELDEALRINLHFGLGKSFNDLGAWEAAFQHYAKGNQLKARSVRLDRRQVERHFDSLIAGFSADGLRRTAELVARPTHRDDELPVLVLGMPRSGTTLVEQVLSSHPTVAGGGELSFWKDTVDRWTISRRDIDATAIAEAADAYRTVLRRIGPDAARVVDKAPGNFQRIWLFRLVFPNGRIVHCRRHPVDTCLSIYFTHFKGRHDYAYDRGDLAFYYRQYERLMDHWRRVLPSDRFMDVDYERLVTDQEEVTRELIAFCGLQWSDACLAPEHNERAVKTASRWQARQPVYASSMQRWRRYEPWLGELRVLLDAFGPTERSAP